MRLDKHSVQYIVKPEEKIVVALIEDTKYDFLNFLDQVYLGNVKEGNLEGFSILTDAYLMPDRFTGIARCDDEDEWNEALGKRIALHKLYKKYNRSFVRRKIKFLNAYEKMGDAVEDFFVRHEEKVIAQEEQRIQNIVSLLGE